MNVQFASCDPLYVLPFLQKGYPSRVLSWEHLPKLKDALERDIARITDPDHHRLALVPGSNYKEEDADFLREIGREINSHP